MADANNEVAEAANYSQTADRCVAGFPTHFMSAVPHFVPHFF
jgi:hypothetical protein